MEPQIVTLSFAGILPDSGLTFSGEYTYRTDALPIFSIESSATYRVSGDITLGGRSYSTVEGQIRVDNDQSDGLMPPTFNDGIAISGNFGAEDNPLERLDFSLSFDAAPDFVDSVRLPAEVEFAALEPVFGFMSATVFDLQFVTAVATEVTTTNEPVDIVNDLTLEEVRTVALLYEAALDRDGNIDLAGLNFWIDQRELGLSESDLALEFIESTEFRNAFGDPDDLSDMEFVEILYDNVLDRAGEPRGVEFWTETLAQPGFDRVDLLIAFAESPENVAGTPSVDDLTETSPGFWEFV